MSVIDKHPLLFIVGVPVAVLAGTLLLKQQTGILSVEETGSGGKGIAPIEIEATLTSDGLPIEAFDRLWRFGDYASQEAWASAAITEIDQFMPPGSTLTVYRPSEQFRGATDALKAARQALGSRSSWVLSLRDLTDITGF